MNFLAHLFLSRHNKDLMIGNYLGDFVKGDINGQYSLSITNGIRLHRQIDSFTDGHPIRVEQRKLFSKKRRRYAGVILDVAYDHFLSRNWAEFTSESRVRFIKMVYQVLDYHSEFFPNRARFFLDWMLTTDMLNKYHQLVGIENAYRLMSGRGRTHSPLIGASTEIRENYDEIREGFLVFFPDLLRQSAVWIKELSADPPS
ncbi:MAG: DUF479 domain-containing protein [Candidatus Marinimicrobia bacterium]|nr:DUF479 domain-containing protein [Candidatus Neomarinimicrobiota bacterium]